VQSGDVDHNVVPVDGLVRDQSAASAIVSGAEVGKGGEFRGSVAIRLPRKWVAGARRILK